MALQITNPYGPATEDAVAAAERELGVTFPTPYRQFLLTTGGAKVSTTVPRTGGGYLQEFYDLDDLLEWNTDGRTYGFGAYIPKQYVMIGGGSGGAPTIKPDDGTIWWADFDKAGAIPDEEPHEEIMTRLADNFDAFLDSF